MGKFWKWMEEKGYDNNLFENQMLIGYMEEYLIMEHGISIGNTDKIFMELHKGKLFADIRYEQLKNQIILSDRKKGD